MRLALAWLAHENLCTNNIYRNGNEAQRRKYLPGLCSGRMIGALGLTEPGAGSDALGSMRTTARRDGDHYVLNGSKIYITNGPIADVLLIYAKTDKAKGAHGISAFIVEKDFPGFRVAQKLEKMGYRGSQTGELVFEECRVPAENLRRRRESRHRDRDERARPGAGDGLAALPRHCRAGARAVGRLRADAPAIRQADRLVPDGAVDARRNVRRGRDHAHLHLPHAGRRRADWRSAAAGAATSIC